jgi:C4-dicarboxylate-specific signal transduction histidine kinase
VSLRPGDGQGGSLHEGFQRTLREGHVEHQRAEVRRPDGEVRQVELSGTLLHYGGRTAVLGIFRDITERLELEELSRYQQEEMARVARISAIGEMATSIAHELNQPLCAISSYAQAARQLFEQGRADEAAEPLALIDEQTEHASQIVRSIRRFVRRDTSHWESLDVNAVVDETLHLIEPQTRRAGLSVERRLSRDLPPIHGGWIELEQVLVNLVMNALEAVSAEGAAAEPHVRIITIPADGGVVLIITDTGPGFGDVSPDRLFETLYTTKAEGLGMGLAITRTIIEGHGGHIHAERVEG